uniref:Major facilitator superfamily (MFS) profile domain-containing protein n=1 Tax=Octactis speculum TaxID=3111310 RepID=A0A7S2E5R6_9STRA
MLFLSDADGEEGLWYHEDMWGGQVDAIIKSISFVGSMIGMCVMGYLGDRIGRNPAFALTSLLMVIFSLASGLIYAPGTSAKDNNVAMGLLLVCRFFLGVGIGGCYPLASTKGAEECGSTHAIDKNQAVGVIYFWQAVGDLFPYISGMVLALLPMGDPLRFRFALSVGLFPPLAVLYMTYGSGESRQHCASSRRSYLEQVRAGFKEHDAIPNFLTTAVCWMLYDVSYYGSNQFTPRMTEKVFGDGVTVFTKCWHGAVDMLVGLPATWHSIWLLRYWGTKRVQLSGFASIAVSSVIVAVVWTPLTSDDASEGSAYILFAIYLLFYYAVNWGAKMGAFVLPQEVYKPEIRATFTGLAAAAGKFGAIVGIWLFEAVTPIIGLVPVMLFVAALSTVGALLSHFYISDGLWDSQKAQMAEQQRSQSTPYDALTLERDAHSSHNPSIQSNPLQYGGDSEN